MSYADPLEDYVASILMENSECSSTLTINSGERDDSIFGMSEEKEEEIFFTQFLD